MGFFKMGKSNDTSRRSSRPSTGSGNASRYADVPLSTIYTSQSHPRIPRDGSSQLYSSYPQSRGRSHSEYPPSSRHATSSRGSDMSYHQRMDVSPIRERTHPNISGSACEDRPISPLGSSRFEQPSPWANRRAPSHRPRSSTMRDEYGFSIRNPHSQRSQGNPYGMSAHAPFSSDEFEHFEPRGRYRGYSEAAVGRSGRGDAYEASRGSRQAYNMQSDFRNGGFSDWLNY